MKHFTKLITSLLLLFLLAALAGCSGTSSSTNDEPAATATDTTTTQSTDTNGTGNNERHDVVFAGPEEDMPWGGTMIQKYTFKTDDTWTNNLHYSSGNVTYAGAGTYTGDPSKDGTLSLIQTKETDNKGGLKDIADPPSFTITISNGKFTFSSTEYTRE